MIDWVAGEFNKSKSTRFLEGLPKIKNECNFEELFKKDRNFFGKWKVIEVLEATFNFSNTFGNNYKKLIIFWHFYLNKTTLSMDLYSE